MVDYLDDSSKTKIDTTRQTLFEKLPPVLILHLKRFVYDKASNDILKERKFVQYPMRLEINPGTPQMNVFFFLKVCAFSLDVSTRASQ